MDAQVRHRCLPVEQMTVLLLQAGEHAALERVAFHVADARLDLALVPRRARLRRQHRQTIVLGERTQLRVQLGIVPVGLLDAGLEVVQHQGPWARRRSARRRFPGSAGTRRSSAARPPRCSPCASGSGRCERHACADACRPLPRPERRCRNRPAPLRRGHTPCGERVTADRHRGAAQSGGRCGTWPVKPCSRTRSWKMRCAVETGGQLGLDDGPIRLTQAGLFRPGRRCRHADGRLAYFDIGGALFGVAGFDTTGALSGWPILHRGNPVGAGVRFGWVVSIVPAAAEAGGAGPRCPGAAPTPWQCGG